MKTLYEVRFLSPQTGNVFKTKRFLTDEDPYTYVSCEYEFEVAMCGGNYEIDEVEDDDE